MKIIGVHTIKGRGLIVDVDTTGLPMGSLKIGCLVHQGDLSWKITSVEMSNPVLPNNRIGLLLRPEGHFTKPLETELDL